jgi:signal transduction histidine kinase/CheY-like chemotaxis protein/AraC-like DNA-binding protein
MNNEIFTEADLIVSHNVNVLYKDAKADNLLQIKQVEELVNNGIDVLMISPNESEPLTPIVESVRARGIPVVVIDRRISSENFDAFIGGNNLSVGRLAGEMSVDLLLEKDIRSPKILSVTGLEGSSPAQERQFGFEEVLSANQLDTDVVKSDWKKQTARKLLDSINKINYKYYDLIFAHNDEMASSASEIYSNSTKKPIIIGVDGLATNGGGLEMVINNKIDGTVSYPPSGAKALRLAFDLALGKSVNKYNYENIFKIDQRNASTLYNEALRVRSQQQKLKSLIENYDSLSLDIEEKNQVILWISILSGLLFISVWLSFFFLYQKNRANNLLRTKQEVINHQNKEISQNRDQLISALKQMEEMSEMKTQFFSNISHEFKNLLALMSLDLDKVVADSSTKSRLTRYLSMINSNLNRLLSYKNLNSDEYPIELKYGDLSETVKEVAMNFKLSIEAKKLKFNVEAPPVFTDYDADVIQKVLSNIISNAIKYTKKGSISIRLFEDDKLIYITIADTGIGIPENEIPKIFERHKRSSLSGEDKDSYGIGLHFCKSLISLMNGKITVSSKLNKGSAFTISLPVKPELENLQKKTHKEIDKSKPTVFIAEDNPHILARIVQILEENYNVLFENNGIDAYKQINYHHPDIVISDILMPGMDGIQLCQKLFDNPSTINIPVLLLSAVQGDEIRTQGYKTGADAFLSKPFSSETLLSRVENLLKKSIKTKTTSKISVQVNSKSDEDNKFLTAISDYLYENISEYNFKIEDLLSELGMSRSKFYRKLKSLTKLSPNDYIRKIRLDYASQILIKADFSIAEVAYKVGFTDVKYFSKIFKKEFNVTPSEYRDKFID